jgi:hypothetical protein
VSEDGRSVHSSPEELAAAEAKLAEAKARVDELSHQVFVAMPADQREMQESITQAERANNYAAFKEAWSALDRAKRQRNARIDELDNAKGDVAVATAKVERIRHTEHRRRTLARAQSLVTATHGELLEEQRQIPARLVRQHQRSRG